jgi:hypothetical protein
MREIVSVILSAVVASATCAGREQLESAPYIGLNKKDRRRRCPSIQSR